MIKAVSFDADGTLLGTFPESPRGFENFFVQVAKNHGKEVTVESILPILEQQNKKVAKQKAEGFKPYASEKNSRIHWLTYYEDVFCALNLPDSKKLAMQMIERFESGEFTRLYPDVLPCLEHFQSKSIPMIVVSNYAPLLKRFLNDLGIEKYFKATLISGIEGIEKPDPAIYRLGAKALTLDAHEILHVGNDTLEDYEAALNAGYQAILVDRDDLHAHKNLPRIKSLLELTHLFG